MAGKVLPLLQGLQSPAERAADCGVGEAAGCPRYGGRGSCAAGGAPEARIETNMMDAAEARHSHAACVTCSSHYADTIVPGPATSLG
jgi:hypothetical protein